MGRDEDSGSTIADGDARTVRLRPREGPGQLRSDDSVRLGVDAAAEVRYVDEGEIARGGMGAIKRVLDTHMLRPCAMKLFEGVGKHVRQDALKFLEEAQITGQLDHPNIVPIYDITVGADGLPQHFTMKLVRGKTLSELIDDPDTIEGTLAYSMKMPVSRRHQEALQLERMLCVFVKICEAVSFAHSRGVVHRDLKPSNVMVGAHGQVYVMDWGVARLRQGERPSEADRVRTDPMRRSQEFQGMVIGTVSYMSPEQAEGDVDAIDARTDVFGLGGVLYKILTGRPPHHGSGDWVRALAQAKECNVSHPQDVVERPLPPRLCEIAMKALSRDRSDRHASVVELQEEVEGFLRGGGWFATRVFPRGTIIIAEGDLGDRAYIIRKGECEVYRESDGATERTVGRLGVGDVFGEMAILTDQPRNASVRALSDVEAFIITRESVDRELERNEWLATIMRALARRFRGSEGA